MTTPANRVSMIDAVTVARVLDYPSLVDALRAAFIDPPTTPLRHSIPIAAAEGQPAGTVLVMPSVRPGGLIGVKLVTIHPSLAGREGGALRSTYLALDARSGDIRGMIDGHALTVRRTAATSVLAATELARPHPDILLVVGTGEICRALTEAYATIIKPRLILVWGRKPDSAARFVAELKCAGIAAAPVSNLADAVGVADIVTAATLSEAPLIFGKDVRPGAHIDLVGGFRPVMRESDDDLVARATIVVDVESTIQETGDIAAPVHAGRIRVEGIATLRQVLTGERCGRSSDTDITLFKSAGHALEDMAAAELVFARAT